MQPEELGILVLQNFNYLIRTRTRGIASCNIAPQSLLYRVAPFFLLKLYKEKENFLNTLFSNVNTSIEIN
jgi:hypothetical protein